MLLIQKKSASLNEETFCSYIDRYLFSKTVNSYIKFIRNCSQKVCYFEINTLLSKKYVKGKINLNNYKNYITILFLGKFSIFIQIVNMLKEFDKWC